MYSSKVFFRDQMRPTPGPLSGKYYVQGVVDALASKTRWLSPSTSPSRIDLA